MSAHADHRIAAAEPTLSRLGLGCSRIGSFNNPQPLADSVRLVQAAIDLGVTTIDTSNIYGQGDSERTIGSALRDRRDRAFLVTKAGKGFSAKMRALRWAKPLLRPILARRAEPGGGAVTARRDAAMIEDWRPAALTASLEASLRRLRTDRVDGFLLHSPPAAVAADSAVAAALAAMRAGGKVRHFGVSCDDSACLDAALAMPGLSLLQLPWGLIAAAVTGGIADMIRSKGVIVMAREVIAMQPGRDPVAAVLASVARPPVATTLVGTTRRANLAALVDATGNGMPA